MQLDPNPSFRRVIPPWYDTDLLCYAAILLMLAVFFFGIVGVTVSREAAEYQGHLWLPLLLSAMSLWVIASIALRLIRRHHRPS
ncbi:MAG: hypothetical protein PVG78_18875 [Desulfobacterales bacterium]|jgi:hypothetical protein